jgi:hypothetical protein
VPDIRLRVCEAVNGRRGHPFVEEREARLETGVAVTPQGANFHDVDAVPRGDAPGPEFRDWLRERTLDVFLKKNIPSRAEDWAIA